MSSVNAIPAHILLNRKDDAASHSTRKLKQGAASAFASHGFGPLDEKDKTDPTKAVKAVNPGGNPLQAPTLSWITQVQGAQK